MCPLTDIRELNKQIRLTQKQRTSIAQRLRTLDPNRRQKYYSSKLSIEELAVLNLRFVKKEVVDFVFKKGVNADISELISSAMFGLYKAITTFNPEKGAEFSSYADVVISNEMLMVIRKRKKHERTQSIEIPVGYNRAGKKIKFQDFYSSEKDIVEAPVENSMVLEQVKGLLTYLKPQESYIINKRYGLDGSPPLFQREVGEELGLRRANICKIELCAIAKLRRLLDLSPTEREKYLRKKQKQ